MKKRTFQILDEMNQEDCKNGTQLVQVGIDLISADKVKGGSKISIGMPESSVWDLMQNKRMAILVLVDKDEYFKREKIKEEINQPKKIEEATQLLLNACIEAEKHHQGLHSEIGFILREAIKKATE